jgi:hypothetical protein
MMEPRPQGEIFDAVLCGHLMPTKSLAFVCEKHIVSLVSDLLRGKFPRAVFWTVWAVIVCATTGVKRAWAESHIGQETFKCPYAVLAIFPSRAASDSPSAIIHPFGILWISGSLDDIGPNPVLCGSSTSATHAMNDSIFPGLNLKASTGFSETTFKVASFHYPLSSARASAVPHFAPSFWVSSSKADHSPAVKGFPRQVLFGFDWNLNKGKMILGIAHGSDGLVSSEDRSTPMDGPCEFYRHPITCQPS